MQCAVRSQRPVAELAPASHAAAPHRCSIQARHCLLRTSLPPTVHIASWLDPPCCPSAPVWCRSSSAPLGSAIWSWLLFNLFILLPWLLPPTPRWLPTTSLEPGSDHVSTPLDCELLQRDLGHLRVESPALFIAWCLAGYQHVFCLVWFGFFLINKHTDGEPQLLCPVFCLVLSLRALCRLLLWDMFLGMLMLTSGCIHSTHVL